MDKNCNLNDLITTYNLKQKDDFNLLTKREINGRLIAEGQLRLYWSVHKPIFLQQTENGKENSLQTNTQNSKSQLRLSEKSMKRLSTFNGHVYSSETSIFKPPFNCPIQVRVTSLLSTIDILHLICDKFQIVNEPNDFSILLRSTTDVHILEDDEYPLFALFHDYRFEVINRPEEDIAYIGLNWKILKEILLKFQIEFQNEIDKVQKRYERYRKAIETHLTDVTTRL